MTDKQQIDSFRVTLADKVMCWDLITQSLRQSSRVKRPTSWTPIY